MRKISSRKRPCRICRRWYLPNPRLKGRQKTCGDHHCQKQWHRKKCAEWNRKNADYFKSNYLHKKLQAATGGDKVLKTIPPDHISSVLPKSRIRSGLPVANVQEVIGIQHTIIIEYLAQLLLRRCHHALKQHLLVNVAPMH